MMEKRRTFLIMSLAMLFITGCLGGQPVLEEPELTLNGDVHLVVPTGVPFADPGATAVDPAEGDISGSVVVGGDAVDTSTAGGPYVVTYDVENAGGLAARQVQRLVFVADVVHAEDFSGAFAAIEEDWFFSTNWDIEGSTLKTTSAEADERAFWDAVALDRSQDGFVYSVRLQSPLRESWPTTYVAIPYLHNHNRRFEIMLRHDSDDMGDAFILRYRQEGVSDHQVLASVANAGLPRNQWIDISWVVDGDAMQIYVDDNPEPIISLTDVEGQMSSLRPAIYTWQELIQVDQTVVGTWSLGN